MKYPTIIVRSINAQNVIFKDTSGLNICLALTSDCPLRAALIHFLILTLNPFELVYSLNYEVKKIFTYNASRLSISDKTPIDKIFINSPVPNVTVNTIR